MAAWMTHFRAADKFIYIINESGGVLDEPCFAFGSVAPDCGVPDADGLNYIPPRDVSHFGHTGSRDYGAFAREYLSDPADVRAYSFYLGYYLHIMTDELWVNKILLPLREKYLSRFSDKTAFALAAREDWNAVDMLFFKNNPPPRSFELFCGMSEADIDEGWFDFFLPGAFLYQLDRIRDLYLAGVNVGDYKIKHGFTSEADLGRFVGEAALELRPEIKKVIRKEEYAL